MLSSDEYEGRAPGSKGETLSVAYLVDQFKKIGLKPGNTDGTYVQKVPLVGVQTAPDATLSWRWQCRSVLTQSRSYRPPPRRRPPA